MTTTNVMAYEQFVNQITWINNSMRVLKDARLAIHISELSFALV